MKLYDTVAEPDLKYWIPSLVSGLAPEGTAIIVSAMKREGWTVLGGREWSIMLPGKCPPARMAVRPGRMVE